MISFGVATTAGTTTADGRTGNGTFTVTLPSGWSVGQLAIIVLYSDQGSGSISAGWNEITGSPWGAGTEQLQAFYRFLQSGDTAPTITISGSDNLKSHCAGIITYNGVDSSTPIEVVGTASNGTGTPMTAGSITTLTDGSFVVGLCGRGDNETASGQTFNSSTIGVTERLDAGTSQGDDSQVSAYDILVGSTGSSGGGSAVTSATDPWVSVIIALKPDQSPTVALNSPSDGGSTTDTTPDLSFTGTDERGSDATYNVQVDDGDTLGSALEFNGTNNLLSLGNLGNFGSNLGSGFYTKFKIKTTSTSIGRFGGFNSGATTAWQILFNSDQNEANSSGKIAFFIRSENGLAIEGATSASTSFNDGSVHDIEITCDPTAKTIVIKVDGSSKTISYSQQNTQTTYVNFVYGNAVGARASSTGFVNFFSCTVDDFEIGTSSSSLYGQYNMNEGGGYIANDSSGAGNDATLINGPTWVNDLTYTPIIDKYSNTDLGFSGSPDNSDPFASGQQVTYTVQSALTPGTYYWRVRAKDPSGSNTWGTWSSTRSFTVSTASTLTATHTIDSFKLKTSASTHTVDSLKYSRSTQTNTVNTLLKVSTYSTHTIDALIKKTSTVAHSVDTLIKKTSTTSNSVDGYIAFPTQTITHSIDGYITKQFSSTYTVDSLTKKTSTTSHSIDAFRKTLNTISNSIDALVVKRQIVTYLVDTLLQKTSISAHTLDSLTAQRHTIAHSLDALVLKRSEIFHSIDAFIDQEGFITHSLDAILKKNNIDTTHTIDAAIATQNTLAYSIDALRIQTQNRTHTIDAYIYARQTTSHTTDSLLSSRSISTSSLDTLKKVNATKSYSISSVLYNVGSKVFTIDGYTLTREISTHSVDGLIVSRETYSYTIDALKMKESERHHTIDTKIKIYIPPIIKQRFKLFRKSPPLSLTADRRSARIKKTGERSFTVGREGGRYTLKRKGDI